MKSIAALLLALLVAACSGGPAATESAAYVITRNWSSGYVETGTVYADGRVVMGHGDHGERVILPQDQMQELAAAAALGVAPGSTSSDPIVGVTIGLDAPVSPADLSEGSLAELLNRVLDSHTLHP
ncbi:MAG: hypothetical protein RIQ87_857 [Chloroflexota bacterium]|jgi:hypothetical protein